MPWEIEESQLEEMRKRLADEASKEDRQFHAVCEDAVRELLSKIMNKDLAEVNVHYYLTGEGSETCLRMIESDRTREEEVLRAVAAIHAIYLSSKRAFNNCYMFLNAPWESSRRNVAEDQDANEMQSEHVYSIWHPSKDEIAKNPREHHVVHSRSDIVKALDRLFQETVMKTRRINIICNGEGYNGEDYPRGSLCLYEESGAPLPIQEFLNMVLLSWERAVCHEALQTVKPTKGGDPQSHTIVNTEEGESSRSVPTDPEPDLPYRDIMEKIPPLPSHISVIMAQCQSYTEGSPPVYSRWGSFFEMIPMTHPSLNNGFATCMYRFNTPTKIPNRRRILYESHHLELEYFAKHDRLPPTVRTLNKLQMTV